jgi:stage II sporulation protein M
LFYKIGKMFLTHLKNNFKIYCLLLLALIVGVSAGAFTVNGLSPMQRDELSHYFQGFIQLLDNQNVDSNELLKIALLENIKIIIILWILGVSIIGIPFIFVLVGIRGFITGFSSGFIIKSIGLKGILFTVFSLLPKEIIIIPCIIALGVNGVNFSLNIIKSKSKKHLLKDNLKKNFFAYCLVTIFYSCFILLGILVEVYITPVFIRMIAPLFTN